MITRFTRPALLFAIMFSAGHLLAQTSPAASAAKEDEFARKKPETKMIEVIQTDSLPAEALMKRAVHWIKEEPFTYRKTAGTTTGNKAECIAMFPVKPKELNPQVDYTGKITMKVLIECKNSRYRFTISDIRHESKNGQTTAGSIDNVVPECGSVAMHDQIWRRLKAEALHNAATVITDLKKAMEYDPVETNEDDW